MKWYLTVLSRYADFSGRARRKEFWFFVLFNFIFLFTALIIDNAAEITVRNGGFGVFYLLYVISVFIPGMAVTVRRLHDTGKSGWLLLIALIPIVGAIWLLVLMMLAGQSGKNEYGQNPVEAGEYARDKRRSAAIALIIASVLWIVLELVTHIGMSIDAFHYSLSLAMLLNMVIPVALLIAGITLFNNRENTKAAALSFITAGALWLIIWLLGFGGPMVFSGSLLLYGALPIALLILGIMMLQKKEYEKFVGILLITGAGLRMSGFIISTAQIIPFYPIDSFYTLNLLRFIMPVALLYAGFWLLYPKSKAGAYTQEAMQPESTVVFSKNTSVEAGAATMSAAPEIKKPNLLWIIIGFAVTAVLFFTSLEYIEDIWYLFVMFILFDLAALGRYFEQVKVYKKMLKEAEGLTAAGAPIVSRALAAPATIRVMRKSSMIGAVVPYKVYLNNEFIDKIKNGKTLDIVTSVSHNIVRVFDNYGNPFAGDFTVDLEEGGYAEVYVKAGRFVKK
ncbi:MAG: DUF805 domain-containing protein [Bacteroidales bacterium]|nr:DUF805 domain-containing protein [Bacteroidales bacterium]